MDKKFLIINFDFKTKKWVTSITPILWWAWKDSSCKALPCFGHSFSKFIYSLSHHKFTKKTSPLAVKTTFWGCFYPLAYDGLRFEPQHTTKQKTSPKGGIETFFYFNSICYQKNISRVLFLVSLPRTFATKS